MSKQTIDFYNKESSTYSSKRYTEKPKGYSHYIFGTRKKFLLDFLNEGFKSLPDKLDILDIGCADGVMFRLLEDKFPGKFKKLVGVDISPKMIEEAKKQNGNPNTFFCLRDEAPEDKFDVVTELGVHPHDFSAELSYVEKHLKPGGLFIYTLTSSDSIYVHLKIKDAPYVKDYKKYYEYEEELSGRFNVQNSKAYALFVPKLWSLPVLARIMQPMIDKLFQHITPNLFHEKIYVLRSKAK